MSADHPGLLVGARKECPLVVGLGEGESFIASAIPAFLAETRRIQLIENGEIVAIDADGARFIDAEGAAVEREVEEVDWTSGTPLRRAATRPSCSRRSTSSPRPWPRRWATA